MKQHKSKFVITVVLITALVAMLGLSTPAFAATQANTDATVEFTSGTLDLVSAPSFDYGTKTIPSAPTSYDLSSATGNLSVSDARSPVGDWEVTAELGNFIGDDTTQIAGTSIVLSNALVGKGNGITGPDAVAYDKTLVSNGAAQKVFDGTGCGVGEWDASWSGADAKLKLDTVSGIKAQAYSATMDWTLTVAP